MHEMASSKATERKALRLSKEDMQGRTVETTSGILRVKYFDMLLDKKSSIISTSPPSSQQKILMPCQNVHRCVFHNFWQCIWQAL